jgi:hypothetical protein
MEKRVMAAGMALWGTAVLAQPAPLKAHLDAAAAGHVATAGRLAWIPLVSAQFTERLTNATGFQGAASLYNLGVTLAWRIDVPTFQNISVQAHVERTARLGVKRATLR